VKYEYFGGWHRYYREATEPLTEREARERHLKGEAYCVVVHEAEVGATAFLEVTRDYFSVNFLDAKRRVYLTYGFEDVGGNRLFLKQAIHSEFAADDDQSVIGTSYYFRENGVVAIERTTHVQTAELTEGSCDVSANWEVRPKFGEYGSLLRKERLTSPARK
jgi:hypothetical protein